MSEFVFNISFTASNNYFCDSVHSFTSNFEDEKWIKIVDGPYEGAIAELGFLINDSCVRLKNNPAWTFDFSIEGHGTFEYFNAPTVVVVDGGAGEFYVGDSKESKFEIKIKNGTGTSGFLVEY